jgi:NAD(P)-dependent dehydrogenase (short-subunit alcohol dehydrogenase family)
MKLNGRVAVVTGAASGIGRAAAEELTKEGAKVVAADIVLPRVVETVKHIEERGGTAFAIETDVSDPDSVGKLVKGTLAKFGEVVSLRWACVYLSKAGGGPNDTCPKSQTA